MHTVVGKLVKFSFSGVIATVVHIIIVIISVEFFKIRADLATIPAFSSAFGISYILNHQWTFNATGGHGKHFSRFFLVAILGLILNYSIMYCCVESFGINYLIALGIAVVFVALFSFCLHSKWSFAQ